MVPPIGTVLAGVNTRTGFMAAPATPPEVMEVNEVIVVPAMMATNVPVVLWAMITPAEVVVAAAMVVDAACAAVGLVMPGIVNERARPATKVPAVIVTVNTPAAEMAAVPAPLVPPAMKVRVPGEATASPAPLSVMMIMPSEGMADAGVRDTVMMPPLAPLTALLGVIAGWFVPRGLWASEVIAAASSPGVKAVSALDESWKPPVTMARAAPRVSPVSVMVMEAVPVAAPAVMSTIEVLVAVAAGVEVAVNDVSLLMMEVTDPKK